MSFKKGCIPWNKGKVKINKVGKINKCIYCGKEIYVFPSREKDNKGKFCSKYCKSNYQKGKKHTIEHNKKIGLAGLGRKYPYKPKPKISGENNPMWKGGITPLRMKIYKSLRTRQWRSDVFTRDNFTCQACGEKSSNGKTIYLEAHHIKEFAKILEENSIKTIDEALSCDELWDINNGVTLCKECHNKTKKGCTTISCLKAKDKSFGLEDCEWIDEW